MASVVFIFKRKMCVCVCLWTFGA